jgi:methionyl-tRNA formyltransferase
MESVDFELGVTHNEAIVTPLRIAFMGSPDFSVPTLQALARSQQVVGVVTKPDRPKGRGLELEPPPVKVAAQALGIEVIQPRRLIDESTVEAIRAWQPDLAVVVAYGKILPPVLLDLPRLGCLNVHASLLPRWRGAAPIQWAVMAGDLETGVTVMRMDPGLDTGPMLAQWRCPIDSEGTAGDLFVELAHRGAVLLDELLPRFAKGQVAEVPQPAAGVTLAPMLNKESGRIDFSLPATNVSAWVRGVDPWPGAFTSFGRDTLRVWSPRVADSGSGPGMEARGALPGTVVACDPRGLWVVCGDGGLVALGELQLPGRKRMSAMALHSGRPIPPGTVLGGRP